MLARPITINCAFFIINLLLVIGFSIRGEFDYIFNPVAMSVLYIIVLVLEKYTPFMLKPYIRVCLTLTLLSHSIVGEYFKIYESSKFFDKGLHFFGTFTFSLIVYNLLSTWIRFRPSHRRLATFVIVLALGISIGTLFELLEYFMDVVFNEYNQRGLKDTNLDQICNLIGAVSAAVWMSKKEPLA